MVERILMVAQRSPRHRTWQTAGLFMAGFASEARHQGIQVSWQRRVGEKIERSGMRKRAELEVLPEVVRSLGVEPTADMAAAEEELKAMNRGETPTHGLSKAHLMEEKRMGMLVNRANVLGKAAKFLAQQTRTPSDEPVLVSIALRHSINKGDTLLPEGERLAEEQGRKTARHLIEHFLRDKKGRFPPTIVLGVSHGGINYTKGQLDWVTEAVTGKEVEGIGGTIRQAEGLITVGYGNGKTKQMLLRQYGITHLH